jgi:CBS domain-containing protein
MTETSIGMLMSRHLVTVAPDTPVVGAEKLAIERRIRHLLVTTPPGELVGVLSVGDLHEAPRGSIVAECMTTRIRTAPPWLSRMRAAAIMRRRRIGSLPVTREGMLVGILTRTDLLCATLEPESLGLMHCARCGYPENLKPDSRAPEATLCLFCRERSLPPPDDCELGGQG